MEGEGSQVGVSSLPFYIENVASSASSGPMMSMEWALGSEMLQKQASALRAEEERWRLRQAIGDFNGDFARVAEHLGIGAAELRERMEALGLHARIVLDDDEIDSCVRW